MDLPNKFEIKFELPSLDDRASTRNKAEIKSIFRELARKYHPDQGGNTAAMQALNEFTERMQALESWQLFQAGLNMG